MPAMIKIAIPAGDLRTPVAGLLESAGLPIEGYGEGSRSYRLAARDNGALTARVFREKDIPVQVALGNYDLGVCSLAWVKEMHARFPNQPIVPLLDLGVGKSSVFVASAEVACQNLVDLGTLPIVRIASEFPNLAELFARSARLRRYRVQAVWGAAEAYPPEDADCVVTAGSERSILETHGLTPLHRLLDNSAWLIGNAKALAARDVSPVVGQFISISARGTSANGLQLPPPIQAMAAEPTSTAERDTLRLAVPDGHQQRHVVEALLDAGLTFDGYDDGETVRRPDVRHRRTRGEGHPSP